MKAIVCTKYGAPGVLQVQVTEKPIAADDEVLIRVYATSVTSADCMMRKGNSFSSRMILGIRKPRKKIQGLEFAGAVEATGEKVTRFKEGDQVYGFTGFTLGAYGEYCCMPERASMVLKPENITFEEAAAVVDGATTALFFLKDKGKIERGNKVLIIGASGGIGTAAVQLARYFGAKVTGVCSTANVELVKSLGADKVIDYTKEDFAENGERYDLIFDTVSKSSFSHCKKSLLKNGRYLVTVMSLKRIFQTVWTGITGGKRVLFDLSIEKNEALLFIKKLLEEGKLKPVIDRQYTMEQIADAHSYVDGGHKRGNVVIRMS